MPKAKADVIERLQYYIGPADCDRYNDLRDAVAEIRKLRKIRDLAQELTNFDMDADGGVADWTHRASRLAVALAANN